LVSAKGNTEHRSSWEIRQAGHHKIPTLNLSVNRGGIEGKILLSSCLPYTFDGEFHWFLLKETPNIAHHGRAARQVTTKSPGLNLSVHRGGSRGEVSSVSLLPYTDPVNENFIGFCERKRQTSFSTRE